MWQGFNLGRLDDAEADALTVLHLGDQLKRLTYQNEARVILARILQLRGDYQASAAQLRQADAPVGASAGTDDEGRALIQSFMGVHLASALGDIDGALHTVRAMLDPASFSRHRWLWQPVWFLDVTHVAVVGGDHGLARRTAESADHLARLTPGVPSNLGVATLTRGLAQDDLSALAAGAEILRNSPRPLLAGTGALELGRALLAQDQRERGVAALEKAGRIFAAMGANGPARIVREALQGSGVRRRRWNNGNQPRPVRGWDALTPTEQRVARLIAAGHTNRSAAAQLVLSPNTIATHVRSIFRKLGVKSRVQLSLAVRDHQ
jgi:DNA-binding CsgD family transcriptional regulator